MEIEEVGVTLSILMGKRPFWEHSAKKNCKLEDIYKDN